MPQKFKRDLRNLSLSANARSGVLKREDAINEYKKPITFEPGLLDYFKKRLEISDEDFDKIMLKKPKSYREFPSYKKLFEFLRPVFFFMYKSNLVPKSFYIKYTSKNDI